MQKQKDRSGSQSQDSGNQQRAADGSAGAADMNRSEALLPAGSADNADGRLEVAEEVSMDQQSDAARRVGQAPQGGAAEALADSLAEPQRRRDPA